MLRCSIGFTPVWTPSQIKPFPRRQGWVCDGSRRSGGRVRGHTAQRRAPLSDMSLHLPTLMTALLLGFLLQTLQLGVAQRCLPARPELGRWALGSWVLLLGLVALSASGRWLSSGLALPLGHALLCLALLLYLQALHRLLRAGPSPRWALWLQPALWLLLVALPGWPPALANALLAAVFAALLMPAAWLVLRRGWRAERALRGLALALCLALLALLGRVGGLAAEGEGPADLGQGPGFVVALAALLAAGFAFVLAVVERGTAQLQRQVTHDELTGCVNRHTTDALLDHELQRARRGGTPLAFVLLDLDHLKRLNARHGRRAGDEALARFAQAVRERLRASDVFGRTGGGEFGLVLPGTDEPGARRLLEGVRQAAAALALADDEGRPVVVTVSAGVAVAQADAEVSADRLYGRADQALYEAKRNGRDRVELYGGSNPRQGSLLPVD